MTTSRDCDLIIEAVFEEMGVKEIVFKQLDAVAKPSAISASTSTRCGQDRNVRKRPQVAAGGAYAHFKPLT